MINIYIFVASIWPSGFVQYNLSHEDEEERDANQRVHDTEYLPLHGLGSDMAIPHSRHDGDGEKDAHVEGEVPGELVGGVVAWLAVCGDNKPLESVQVGCDGLQ